MIKRILITVSVLSLLSACGGPGDNAEVPEAQPAGATKGHERVAFGITAALNRDDPQCLAHMFIGDTDNVGGGLYVEIG